MSPLGRSAPSSAGAPRDREKPSRVAGRPDVPRQIDEGQGKDRFVTDGLQTPGSSMGRRPQAAGQ